MPLVNTHIIYNMCTAELPRGVLQILQYSVATFFSRKRAYHIKPPAKYMMQCGTAALWIQSSVSEIRVNHLLSRNLDPVSLSESCGEHVTGLDSMWDA